MPCHLSAPCARPADSSTMPRGAGPPASKLPKQFPRYQLLQPFPCRDPTFRGEKERKRVSAQGFLHPAGPTVERQDRRTPVPAGIPLPGGPYPPSPYSSRQPAYIFAREIQTDRAFPRGGHSLFSPPRLQFKGNSLPRRSQLPTSPAPSSRRRRTMESRRGTIRGGPPDKRASVNQRKTPK